MTESQNPLLDWITQEDLSTLNLKTIENLKLDESTNKIILDELIKKIQNIWWIENITENNLKNDKILLLLIQLYWRVKWIYKWKIDLIYWAWTQKILDYIKYEKNDFLDFEEYKVEKWDTLWNIVKKKYNLTEDKQIKIKIFEILELNYIKNTNQKLINRLKIDSLKIQNWKIIEWQDWISWDILYIWDILILPIKKAQQEIIKIETPKIDQLPAPIIPIIDTPPSPLNPISIPKIDQLPAPTIPIIDTPPSQAEYDLINWLDTNLTNIEKLEQQNLRLYFLKDIVSEYWFYLELSWIKSQISNENYSQILQILNDVNFELWNLILSQNIIDQQKILDIFNKVFNNQIIPESFFSTQKKESIKSSFTKIFDNWFNTNTYFDLKNQIIELINWQNSERNAQIIRWKLIEDSWFNSIEWVGNILEALKNFQNNAEQNLPKLDELLANNDYEWINELLKQIISDDNLRKTITEQIIDDYENIITYWIKEQKRQIEIQIRANEINRLKIERERLQNLLKEQWEIENIRIEFNRIDAEISSLENPQVKFEEIETKVEEIHQISRQSILNDILERRIINWVIDSKKQEIQESNNSETNKLIDWLQQISQSWEWDTNYYEFAKELLIFAWKELAINIAIWLVTWWVWTTLNIWWKIWILAYRLARSANLWRRFSRFLWLSASMSFNSSFTNFIDNVLRWEYDDLWEFKIDLPWGSLLWRYFKKFENKVWFLNWFIKRKVLESIKNSMIFKIEWEIDFDINPQTVVDERIKQQIFSWNFQIWISLSELWLDDMDITIDQEWLKLDWLNLDWEITYWQLIEKTTKIVWRIVWRTIWEKLWNLIS